MDQRQKILAIKLREIGDTVLWTPALANLRRNFPKARIDLLVLEKCAPLLENHPAIDWIHSIPNASLATLVSKLWNLRRENYQKALGFHATTSLCRSIWLLGARERVLHHHSWHSTPSSSTYKLPRPGNLEDVIQRDGQLLEAMGLKQVPEPTALHLSKEEREWAERVLPSGKVGLFPGGSSSAKRYPRDQWIKLLDGRNLVVISDLKLSKEWGLEKECHIRGIQLFDNLTIRQLMALTSRLRVAVGNDSGPIHIAAALGVRTVAIFGPGCIGDFHPYSEKEHAFLRKIVECRSEGPRDRDPFQYCTLKSCSHHSCMKGIEPKEVVETVTRLF